MNRNMLLILTVLVTFIFLISTTSYADECFDASSKLNDNAQTVRLTAQNMGWKVGKIASISAATIVKGKVEMYPQGTVQICLRELGDTLQIKAQSKSEDAGKAEWHQISKNKR